MSRLESYTKDELRKALRQRGVAVPTSISKDELMKLYRQKVSKPRIEFSDGDLSSSPALRRKVASQKRVSLDSYLPGIRGMSDGELVTELREYGSTPGPITDTTRSVYQKKLASLKAKSAASASRVHKASGEEDVDYGSKDSNRDDLSSEAELGESSHEEEEVEPRPVRIPLVAEYRQVSARPVQGSPGKTGPVQRKPTVSAGIARKSLKELSADKPSRHPPSSPSVEQETTWCSCAGQTVAILLILLATVLLVVFLVTGELPSYKQLGYNG